MTAQEKAAPEAEATSVEQLLTDILGQYSIRGDWRAIDRESGMNNTTRLIVTDNARYAIRLYDNHQDNAIVQLEHEVLQFLAESDFVLQVPEPIRSSSGSTVTAASTGKLASLFRYIDGNRPSSSNEKHVHSLGYAAGLLSRAMAQLQTNSEPQYQPYYELMQSYEGWTDEKVIDTASRCSFDDNVMSAIRRILAVRANLAPSLTILKKLPHQWIHGDLNFSNAVAVGDEVVGVLDFEFCTVDLRAMEPSVVMVDFINADRTNEQRLKAIDTFATGFGEALRLTSDEAEAIPSLMKLRMLDVFLHFAIRCADGLDAPDVWKGQIRHADAVCQWINERHDELATLLRSRLGE
ncbi:homoserine kinase type II [Paenibacillus cellulosilyticus]|uniref:Homoserine kinase type II n=1 Tax=Paenibacillus cellulosilyticus TaxID=375489 RepID=A0A2V2YRU3_9BACL|nr:phosphotransferase [Paenibacillus cellulosilyticus]PWW00732.1 homoserine kinase type II [Paenibacillus cellulosilyticus]QKS45588.1 phosphotransferase [Paenibacillus cellulosilyticus]